MPENPTPLKRLSPIALSTLALLAVQDAQQSAQAATQPDGKALDVAVQPDAVDDTPTVAADLTVAPPEAVDTAPAKAIAPKPDPKTETAIAAAPTAPEAIAQPELLPSPEVNAAAKVPTPAAQSLTPTPRHSSRAEVQVSQSRPTNELFVRPTRPEISYGDPIQIAEDDPLNDASVGSYYMQTDRTVRREDAGFIRQTPDQYAAEIRACLAARPALYRLRDVDGERVLLPVLFDGQLGTLVNDADGRPICPSIRDRARSLVQEPAIEIPVQVPDEALVTPDSVFN